MGDIVSLVEKASEDLDEEKIKLTEEKIKKAGGKLNIVKK